MSAPRPTARRSKLDLDPVTVRKARSLARQAGRPIVDLARKHTTVSVERATVRRGPGRHPVGEPSAGRRTR
jgi:beta-lysine 5,6-aminomutase alpha subunit